MGVQRHAPFASPPGVTIPPPLYRLLYGPQGWSGLDWCEKFCPPHSSGFDPVTFQPVVSYYTDWAISGRLCIIVRCCQLHEQTQLLKKCFIVRGSRMVAWVGIRPSVSCETVVSSSCRSFRQIVPLRHSVGPLSETTLTLWPCKWTFK